MGEEAKRHWRKMEKRKVLEKASMIGTDSVFPAGKSVNAFTSASGMSSQHLLFPLEPAPKSTRVIIFQKDVWPLGFPCSQSAGGGTRSFFTNLRSLSSPQFWQRSGLDVNSKGNLADGVISDIREGQDSFFFFFFPTQH